MGGRGSSGGGSGGGGGNWSKPSLTGSEKQVKWANDIIDGAIESTRAMDRNVDRFAANGLGASYLGYTKQDVSSVRSFLQNGFSQVTKASAIIDERRKFTFDAVEKLVKYANKTGQVWDKKKKKMVKK